MKTAGSTFLNTLDFLNDRREQETQGRKKHRVLYRFTRSVLSFLSRCTKSKQKGPVWYTRRIPKRDDETQPGHWHRAPDDSFPRHNLAQTETSLSFFRSDGEQKIAWKEGRRRKGGGSRGLNRKLWGSIIGEPRSSTVNQGLLLSSRKFRGEGRRERGDKRRRLIPREHFVRSENWWTWSRCAIAFINLT